MFDQKITLDFPHVHLNFFQSSSVGAT